MTPKWITNFVDGIRGFLSVPAIVIDGGLYLGIAVTGFWMAFFGTDEAAKFISPPVLFWLKCGIGSFDAAFLSLKMYRSTAFASHTAEKKTKDEATAFFKKQQENG